MYAILFNKLIDDKSTLTLIKVWLISPHGNIFLIKYFIRALRESYFFSKY